MDDLWELTHPAYLDPLDSSDAFALSPEPAAGGLTNLQYYRRRFGLSDTKPQYYSREVSLFNFGAAINSVEAIFREVFVFNNIQNPPTRTPIKLLLTLTLAALLLGSRHWPAQARRQSLCQRGWKLLQG